jgi:hypothetical protein
MTTPSTKLAWKLQSTALIRWIYPDWQEQQCFIRLTSVTLPRRLIEIFSYSPSNRLFRDHIVAFIPVLTAHGHSLGLTTHSHGIGGGSTLALELL